MNKDNIISILNANENNLKSVSIDIPKNKFVVITGPSGSGKSSLAFDTLYAEGQRRYIESMSNYAKQFLNIQKKPDVESITGLSPAIAIDQKNTSNSPRSTVGTVTEMYDFLRILFARIGVPYSDATGLPMKKQSSSDMIIILLSLPVGTKIRVCAPVIRDVKGSHLKELQRIFKLGYNRVKINGKQYDLSESIPVLDKSVSYTIEVVIDRIIMQEDSKDRISFAIDSAMKLSSDLVHVDIVEMNPGECILSSGFVAKDKETIFLSTNLYCPISKVSIGDIEPRLFSFNSPFGCCENCKGVGTEKFFSEEFIVDSSLSLKDGAIKPWNIHSPRYYSRLLSALSRKFNFSIDIPYCELSKDVQNILMNGSDEKITINLSDGYVQDSSDVTFKGVLNELSERYENSDDNVMIQESSKYQTDILCRSCNGYRLNKKALSIKIHNKNIGQVSEMTVSELIDWFGDLKNHLSNNEKEISRLAVQEILNRLGFLNNVGLGYLSLLRSAASLSGGESQRIRLASQIGSGLSGVLYVLDEPSIGLHQSDNQKLIVALKNLRDLGNSIVVIEHDHDTMLEADYLIDVGPEAGKYGGQIISHGTVKEVMNDPKSITGKFLSGEYKIELPKGRKAIEYRKHFTIKNARENNLKNIDATFYVGAFNVVCGVSGGGKSTLVNDILYKAISKKLYRSLANPGLHDEIIGLEHFDKVIYIDQSPIGRTPRSNPATYIGVFNLIRDLFASLAESRVRGYEAGRFSFNVKGGRCESCQGDGMVKIEMHFLPDVYVPCESCEGKRYNKETLEIKYKGYSISDILEMDVKDALVVFSEIPYIYDKLLCLDSVGLNYVKLGQPSNHLSGGEAQRIKLAKELSRKSTGSTLYILDEPTTGLHLNDIKRLLGVLQKLVEAGNTMLIIEHNLDVIKTADHVIDFGPVGGKNGGYIVASGTPEEISKNEKSVTGKFLQSLLNI